MNMSYGQGRSSLVAFGMLKEQIQTELKSISKKEKAEISKRFFKAGKGEYGEGDIFVGITVPEIRDICKKYFKEMTLEDVEYFIQHKIHEYRLFGLITLTYMWKMADEIERKDIFNLYVKNLKYVNNWDLVDLSAPNIVGEYLKEKDRTILYDFAKSNNLWKQRVAIISTFSFIRDKDFVDTLKISKMLLHHKNDLIHKAVGWMLREVGKRDQIVEEEFLRKYYKEMPRTMLRYSIEKFDEDKRQKYLKGLV